MNATVRDALESGKRCWVITGDASILVDRALNDLVAWGRERCGPPAFNLSTAHGSDPAAVQAIATARTLPMMAPLRVVVVREIDQAEDAFFAALVGYLEEPCPSTLLVVAGAGFPKVRKGGSNWATRVANAVKRHGVQQKFSSEDVSPVAFAREHASSVGATLGPVEARLLVDLVGRDLGLLAREVEKIALYVGASPIDVDAVHAACTQLAEAEVWALTSAIVARDPASAMTSLQRLLDGGDAPHRLLGLVVWQLRQVLQIIELARAGRSERDIREAVRGVRSEVVAKAVANAQKTPGSAAVLETLARANRSMNSHRAGDRRVLEALVLELCT